MKSIVVSKASGGENRSLAVKERLKASRKKTLMLNEIKKKRDPEKVNRRGTAATVSEEILLSKRFSSSSWRKGGRERGRREEGREDEVGNEDGWRGKGKREKRRDTEKVDKEEGRRERMKKRC